MPGPLEGIRVVDFGQFLAGPFAPMLLADLGADVIKVEPTSGDKMRMGVPGSFMGCQRGKRGVGLDLKHPDGLRIALELVATADVVHHNMTLGTADRLGVGYQHCRSVRADIIYCNTYMYGATGPLAHLGGLDPLGQAACGIEWEQGPVAAGNPPLWYRYGHGDAAAAMSSVIAVLMALFHRGRGGGGQSMWASLFHGSMLYTADSWLGPDGTPTDRPVLDREQLGLAALYRLYETQDGWLQLAAVRPDDWPALCRVVGLEDLVDDQRFATPAARQTHRDELTALLSRAFMGDLAVNWRRALAAAGVPAEVSVDTMDGETILFDAELERLGLITEYVHPLLGRVRQFGNLITFSETPGSQIRATPMLGQHSDEVLGELGYDRAAVDDLVSRGVVCRPGPDYRYQV
ncbi:MAG TPA: CoA transferase [Acidimicrobiales bacterium]|nr:CoA transferase [Acidimicrobiales bacterium]